MSEIRIIDNCLSKENFNFIKETEEEFISNLLESEEDEIKNFHNTLPFLQNKNMTDKSIYLDSFDDIKKEKSTRGTRSRIAEILDEMSKADAADLLKALDDHSIPASSISKALNKRGLKLAINVISRYRRGELVTKVNNESV